MTPWAEPMTRFRIMPDSSLNPPDPAILSQGDARSSRFDWNGASIHRVQSANDAVFDVGYARLWEEFGRRHEIESRDILERRLRWNPRSPIDGWSLLYEMVVILKDGHFVAVRDHTAMAPHDRAAPHAVVHLSHALVDPAFRRTGVAGWLRAFPILTARTCLVESGHPCDAPITLVGEMEPVPDTSPAASSAFARRRAYEKSGFLEIDPAAIDYHQPDFRSPAEIDASSGPRPLPMNLILRRIGRERETTLTGREARDLVASLHRMYALTFREQDMRALPDRPRRRPDDDAIVPLLAPTLPFSLNTAAPPPPRRDG